jgi:tetratricopeptide (TPR) repeat protein
MFNMGHHISITRGIAVALGCCAISTGPLLAQDEPVVPAATNAVSEIVEPLPTQTATAPSPMTVFTSELIEQFKEKQQATIDALIETQARIEQTARLVEQSRLLAETNAVEAATSLDIRFNALEEKLARQRSRDIKSMQDSQQFTMLMVCVVAGLGIAGVVAMSIYMLRYVHRRTEMIVAAHPIGPSYSAGALGNGQTALATLDDPATQSGAQLINALERIEKRMLELESPPTPSTASTAANGNGLVDVSAAARAQADRQAHLSLLLGKAQSLMNLDQHEEAIACFDEVIHLDPANAEAYVKKGTALEKLGHLDEAIDNYDRAIALDDSLTMAYLCKGGVFNRLDRFNEALQCYEQALHAQKKIRIG